MEPTTSLQNKLRIWWGRLKQDGVAWNLDCRLKTIADSQE